MACLFEFSNDLMYISSRGVPPSVGVAFYRKMIPVPFLGGRELEAPKSFKFHRAQSSTGYPPDRNDTVVRAGSIRQVFGRGFEFCGLCIEEPAGWSSLHRNDGKCRNETASTQCRSGTIDKRKKAFLHRIYGTSCLTGRSTSERKIP